MIFINDSKQHLNVHKMRGAVLNSVAENDVSWQQRKRFKSSSPTSSSVSQKRLRHHGNQHAQHQQQRSKPVRGAWKTVLATTQNQDIINWSSSQQPQTNSGRVTGLTLAIGLRRVMCCVMLSDATQQPKIDKRRCWCLRRTSVYERAVNFAWD